MRPQRKNLPPEWMILICAVFIVSVNNNTSVLGQNAGSNTDILAYTLPVVDGEISWMLYDPDQGVSEPLLPDIEFDRFNLSADGRIAFSAMPDGNAEIYLLGSLADRSPVNISQNPTADDYPLSWSHDGHFLAFVSNHNDDNWQLYVWDGEVAINITPHDIDDPAEGFSVLWSFDGRLVFTVWPTFSSRDEDSPGEIYLWDGHTTTSLSQNPAGEDSEPTWNVDGRLAFLSERDGDYDIFVWDGVSVKNGSPDVDTFTNVSPELTAYYSDPIWTTNGDLAFASQSSQDTHAQIYVWNGQTASNISQNPTLHNGSPRWSADGGWVFVTFFSSQQLLYVRDADNHTLLTVEGQYTPAWSSNGYLAFCTRSSPGWVLSVWDGEHVIEITQGYDISAKWQSGAGVFCSSG